MFERHHAFETFGPINSHDKRRTGFLRPSLALKSIKIVKRKKDCSKAYFLCHFSISSALIYISKPFQCILRVVSKVRVFVERCRYENIQYIA